MELRQAWNSLHGFERHTLIFSCWQAWAFALIAGFGVPSPCCSPPWSPPLDSRAFRQASNSEQERARQAICFSWAISPPHFLSAASRAGDFSSACVIFPVLNLPKNSE